MDPEALQELAQVAVPDLADWCSVSLPGDKRAPCCGFAVRAQIPNAVQRGAENLKITRNRRLAVSKPGLVLRFGKDRSGVKVHRSRAPPST